MCEMSTLLLHLIILLQLCADDFGIKKTNQKTTQRSAKYYLYFKFFEELVIDNDRLGYILIGALSS